MADLYPRTLRERLADGAPYLGAVALAAIAESWWTAPWQTITVAVAALALIAVGVERGAHYRGQRDRYRRALVKQVRNCGHRHGHAERADYFEDHVPADVLAEAFRTPTFSIDLGEADRG